MNKGKIEMLINIDLSTHKLPNIILAVTIVILNMLVVFCIITGLVLGYWENKLWAIVVSFFCGYLSLAFVLPPLNKILKHILVFEINKQREKTNENS